MKNAKILSSPSAMRRKKGSEAERKARVGCPVGGAEDKKEKGLTEGPPRA